MSERKVQILRAAEIVFSRYGVSKTTMNDIAKTAGVARQTLYNEYPNKASVLRATLRFGAEKTMAAVEARWRNQQDLGDKLDTFFELGPLYWYDAVQSSPEIADLIDGINSIAHEELIDLSNQWANKFAALLELPLTNSSTSSPNAKALADFVYSTSMNAKYYAQNREVLETRLKVLKQAVLSLIS